MEEVKKNRFEIRRLPREEDFFLSENIYVGRETPKRSCLGKKIFLCLIFFIVSPLCLFWSLWLSYSSSNIKGDILGSYEATPTADGYKEQFRSVIATAVLAEDGRKIMISNYLRRFNSPLVPFSGDIVDVSDKYGVDPYLIVAIAQQESNLGKNSPQECFNAWGWGIHSKGTLCFGSWSEALEVVTKGIAKEYCAKGYCDDPCRMMKKYTPRSNGSWCFGVNMFLEQLRTGNF